MSRLELPTSLCPYIANQGTTTTAGGDHPAQHTGRDFLPPLQNGSLDCTCEDEHTPITAGWSIPCAGSTMQGPPCPSVQKCMLKDWTSSGSWLSSCSYEPFRMVLQTTSSLWIIGQCMLSSLIKNTGLWISPNLISLLPYHFYFWFFCCCLLAFFLSKYRMLLMF